MKYCVIFEILDAYGRGISPRTVRLSGELTGVNRPPARYEDVIFVTSTFHMSMESSFETQFQVVLLKTDPEHHFPDPHSFKLSNRTDNLNSFQPSARRVDNHTSSSEPSIAREARTAFSSRPYSPLYRADRDLPSFRPRLQLSRPRHFEPPSAQLDSHTSCASRLSSW